MAPPYTNKEKDMMDNGRVPPHRTQGGARKKQNRDARKAKSERKLWISAEDWLQPLITPESFPYPAATYQVPAIATHSLGRQAVAPNHQHELAKHVADLVDLAEHMNGKPGEVHATMQETTRRIAQLKDHANLPDFIDFMNQNKEPTHLVSDIPPALTLSSIATPVLSTSVNPPPNADQDLFVGSDFLQLNNEVASSTHEADRDIPWGLNKHTSVAFVGHANPFADSIGEGSSDDRVLRVVCDSQVEAVTESSRMGEDDEELDFEQYILSCWD